MYSNTGQVAQIKIFFKILQFFLHRKKGKKMTHCSG